MTLATYLSISTNKVGGGDQLNGVSQGRLNSYPGQDCEGFITNLNVFLLTTNSQNLTDLFLLVGCGRDN